MKMKTSELTGAALDWAVAKCEGLLAFGWEDDMGLLKITLSTGETEYFIPTMKWEQGGPIIERERIDVLGTVNGPTGEWTATAPRQKLVGWRWIAIGPTPLIAAMRCYVASKLGDDINIPEELL
jgi:hypothetical protein